MNISKHIINTFCRGVLIGMLCFLSFPNSSNIAAAPVSDAAKNQYPVPREMSDNLPEGDLSASETYTALDASSDNLFEPYINYPVESPETVGVGDFNNDGRLDAAVTNADEELRIFVQNQSGSLDEPTIYAVGATPNSLAVGDFNNDGRDDIVVANFSDYTISVFIQQSDGSLLDRVTYATGYAFGLRPDAVAVGDINADGLDDIAISNYSSRSSSAIGVFTQNTDGTLNARVDYSAPHTGYNDIAIGDVNGDGLNDVVKMNGQGEPHLSVFLQNESGSLDIAVSHSLIDCEFLCAGNGIGLGDVTGDGKTDVVMSYGGNTPTSHIAIFAQSEEGTLLPAVSYSEYDLPEAVEVADVNSDGLADVIVGHRGWDAVSVHAQHSSGGIGEYTLYPLREYSDSSSIAIGDINNDNLPDILVANPNYGLDILYHINTDSPPPTVTSIMRTDTNPTDASNVGFAVTFDKAVTGVDTTDFTVFTTGTISDASILTVTGSNDSYEVTVNTGSGEGTIRLDVNNDDSIQDFYGTPLDGDYTDGETYTTMEVLSTDLFEPYYNYIIQHPYAVGVGDFNNDGRLDAAVTNSAEELRIFIQDQAGNLSVSAIYETGTKPVSLAVGDFNCDGRDDIVVTNALSNTISLFLQQADGALANRVTLETGTTPNAVAAGDLNADGLDDIAVSNSNSAYISIFIQNTNGTLNTKFDYAYPNPDYDAWPDDIAIGDVNGDGLNDVVKMVAEAVNHQISVFLQNVSGSLDPAVQYSLVDCEACFSHGIGLGDVTGDGKTDVVMSSNASPYQISVFAQAEDGSLLDPVSYSGYAGSEPVEVVDVNEDGMADVISGSYDVSVHAQHSIGVLGSYTLYPLRDGYSTLYGPQALAIGDINNDSLPDILVANYGYGLDILYHINPDAPVTPPVITSITRTDTNPTDASLVGFTVAFSEAVTGVDKTDFALTTTGTVSGAYVQAVAGSNNFYEITVATGLGEGTILLDVINDNSIQDFYGTPLDGDYTSGETYTTMEVLSAGLFQPYINYPIESPKAVGVGDFNNDGRLDVAVTNADGELRIFIQNSSGSLDNPMIYTTGVRPEDLAVGDFNHDGRDDIVVANWYDNTISVFFQQEDSSLANQVTYATGSGPGAVAVGDINADGLDDIAVSSSNSSYIGIFIQNADGTLNTKVDYSSPEAGYDDIAIGDINGDGLNDVVKMNGQENPNLSIYLQNEDGTLAAALSYSLTDCDLFCTGNGVGLGDVTGDGKADVVMSYGGNISHAYIAVFAQAEDGSLLDAVSYSTYDIPRPVEVEDVNDDGMADVIVAHSGWRSVSVHAQHSLGVLGGYTLYSLGLSVAPFSPHALAIGDINNDASPDVLIANYHDGLTILYHTPCPPTISSILRTEPSPTNATNVNFTVTFSKTVTGVDASDFTLTTTGVSGTSITNVSGSGDTRIVTVNTGSGNGTIRLDLVNDGSIVDGSGNPLSGGYTSGEEYTVDKTAPTISSIIRTEPNPVSADSVRFTMTFSEDVTGVDTSDFILTTTGISGTSIYNLDCFDDTCFVRVSTGSGNGTIRLDVKSSGTGIQDLAGNPLSGGFTSGDVYIIDKSGPLTRNQACDGTTSGGCTQESNLPTSAPAPVPTVSSITHDNTNPTGASPVDSNSDVSGASETSVSSPRTRDLMDNPISGGLIDGEVYIIEKSNDYFEFAANITTLNHAYSIDTMDATSSPTDPVFPAQCGLVGSGKATLWYKYELKDDDVISINTKWADYDTFVAIWEGTAIDEFRFVACNDDTGGTKQSAVSIRVTGDKTYYIEIGQPE